MEHKIKISPWAIMVYCPDKDHTFVGKQVGVLKVKCPCGKVIKSTEENTE